MWVCVRACMCVWVRECMFKIYVHVCVWVCVCVRACARVRNSLSLDVSVFYIRVCVCISEWIYLRVCACICLYVYAIHACIYARAPMYVSARAFVCVLVHGYDINRSPNHLQRLVRVIRQALAHRGMLKCRFSADRLLILCILTAAPRDGDMRSV